jgi:hypothetical protein
MALAKVTAIIADERHGLFATLAALDHDMSKPHLD